MPGQNSEDRELIAKFLAGEADAVAMVGDWLRRAALPFRRRLSGEWDDILQDLHIEVLGLLRSETFRGESRLKGYLWKVVAHSCLDRIRKAKYRQWTELEEAVAAGVPLTAAPDRLPPWNPSRDLLMRVLERTPQGCRRLWDMVAAGFSYQEMSGRVGASESALRVRVLRCRQKASRVRAELLDETGADGGSSAAAREDL